MCNKLCKTQKVILDGKDIVIRKPRMRDDSSLLRFVNSLVKEDAMIDVNRASSLKEERKWLKENLENFWLK